MNRIKEARLKAGLSQQKLSDWLGIPKRTIENWDAGISDPPNWAENLIVEKIERDSGELTGKENGGTYEER